jgi:hypothetical protein
MAGGVSNFLSKLFGGSGAGQGAAGAAPAEEHYNGYTIRPEPFQNGGQWITSGVIEKRFDDGTKQHKFIRADMYPAREAATEASVFKAKQMIDMMGDDVFALDGD